MKPSMFYVISDTHFNHENIIRSGARPANYQELILSNLERTLRPQDVLIHLGDVSWSAQIEERFIKLPCKKILVRGNHDKQTYFWYMRHGFDAAVESLSLTYQEYDILFTHKPVSYSELFMRRRAPRAINICGHLHNFEGSRKEFPWVYTIMNYHVVVLEENGYMSEKLDNIIGKIKAAKIGQYEGGGF